LKAHIIREVSGIVAMSMLFYAITKMNLALGTAITFAAPLFTAVIAWFVFNDRPDKHKICALVIGFFGCIIVIRPGLEGFNPYSILMFGAAIFWGVNGILVKKLGATEHPLKIIFYQTFFMIFLSLPLAWLVWKSPTPDQIYVVIVIALVSNVLQYTLAKALSLTQFSVILPFDYTRLIFTAIIAYYSFGETVDEFTIIGSLVIMSSAIYTAVRERRKPTTIAMD
jgi:drug/metabolite transporter (DMT)-like permease